MGGRDHLLSRRPIDAPASGLVFPTATTTRRRPASVAALRLRSCCNSSRLACESPPVVNRDRAHENEPSVSRARGERGRLSVRVRGLLGRRSGVCRREEPPRDESGLRAHGSNQRFHRLLGHAVARALTTAPRLAGLGPAAPRILIDHGWRRKAPPGTLSLKGSRRLAARLGRD